MSRVQLHKSIDSNWGFIPQQNIRFPQGAFVVSIFSHSPAFHTALKAGDVITSVNGQSLLNCTGQMIFEIFSRDPTSADIEFLSSPSPSYIHSAQPEEIVETDDEIVETPSKNDSHDDPVDSQMFVNEVVDLVTDDETTSTLQSNEQSSSDFDSGSRIEIDKSQSSMDKDLMLQCTDGSPSETEKTSKKRSFSDVSTVVEEHEIKEKDISSGDFHDTSDRTFGCTEVAKGGEINTGSVRIMPPSDEADNGMDVEDVVATKGKPERNRDKKVKPKTDSFNIFLPRRSNKKINTAPRREPPKFLDLLPSLEAIRSATSANEAISLFENPKQDDGSLSVVIDRLNTENCAKYDTYKRAVQNSASIALLCVFAAALDMAERKKVNCVAQLGRVLMDCVSADDKSTNLDRLLDLARKTSAERPLLRRLRSALSAPSQSSSSSQTQTQTTPSVLEALLLCLREETRVETASAGHTAVRLSAGVRQEYALSLLLVFAERLVVRSTRHKCLNAMKELATTTELSASFAWCLSNSLCVHMQSLIERAVTTSDTVSVSTQTVDTVPWYVSETERQVLCGSAVLRVLFESVSCLLGKFFSQSLPSSLQCKRYELWAQTHSWITHHFARVPLISCVSPQNTRIQYAFLPENDVGWCVWASVEKTLSHSSSAVALRSDSETVSVLCDPNGSDAGERFDVLGGLLTLEECASLWEEVFVDTHSCSGIAAGLCMKMRSLNALIHLCWKSLYVHLVCHGTTFLTKPSTTIFPHTMVKILTQCKNLNRLPRGDTTDPDNALSQCLDTKVTDKLMKDLSMAREECMRIQSETVLHCELLSLLCALCSGQREDQKALSFSAARDAKRAVRRWIQRISERCMSAQVREEQRVSVAAQLRRMFWCFDVSTVTTLSLSAPIQYPLCQLNTELCGCDVSGSRITQSPLEAAAVAPYLCTQRELSRSPSASQSAGTHGWATLWTDWKRLSLSLAYVMCGAGPAQDVRGAAPEVLATPLSLALLMEDWERAHTLFRSFTKFLALARLCASEACLWEHTTREHNAYMAAQALELSGTPVSAIGLSSLEVSQCVLLSPQSVLACVARRVSNKCLSELIRNNAQRIVPLVHKLVAERSLSRVADDLLADAELIAKSHLLENDLKRRIVAVNTPQSSSSQPLHTTERVKELLDVCLCVALFGTQDLYHSASQVFTEAHNALIQWTERDASPELASSAQNFLCALLFNASACGDAWFAEALSWCVDIVARLATTATARESLLPRLERECESALCETAQASQSNGGPLSPPHKASLCVALFVCRCDEESCVRAIDCLNATTQDGERVPENVLSSHTEAMKAFVSELCEALRDPHNALSQRVSLDTAWALCLHTHGSAHFVAHTDVSESGRAETVRAFVLTLISRVLYAHYSHSVLSQHTVSSAQSKTLHSDHTLCESALSAAWVSLARHLLALPVLDAEVRQVLSVIKNAPFAVPNSEIFKQGTLTESFSRILVYMLSQTEQNNLERLMRELSKYVFYDRVKRKVTRLLCDPQNVSQTLFVLTKFRMFSAACEYVCEPLVSVCEGEREDFASALCAASESVRVRLQALVPLIRPSHFVAATASPDNATTQVPVEDALTELSLTREDSLLASLHKMSTYIRARCLPDNSDESTAGPCRGVFNSLNGILFDLSKTLQKMWMPSQQEVLQWWTKSLCASSLCSTELLSVCHHADHMPWLLPFLLEGIWTHSTVWSLWQVIMLHVEMFRRDTARAHLPAIATETLLHQRLWTLLFDTRCVNIVQNNILSHMSLLDVFYHDKVSNRKLCEFVLSELSARKHLITHLEPVLISLLSGVSPSIFTQKVIKSRKMFKESTRLSFKYKCEIECASMMKKLVRVSPCDRLSTFLDQYFMNTKALNNSPCPLTLVTLPLRAGDDSLLCGVLWVWTRQRYSFSPLQWIRKMLALHSLPALRFVDVDELTNTSQAELPFSVEFVSAVWIHLSSTLVNAEWVETTSWISFAEAAQCPPVCEFIMLKRLCGKGKSTQLTMDKLFVHADFIAQLCEACQSPEMLEMYINLLQNIVFMVHSPLGMNRNYFLEVVMKLMPAQQAFLDSPQKQVAVKLCEKFLKYVFLRPLLVL